MVARFNGPAKAGHYVRLLLRCRGIAAVETVHHRLDPRRDEHLRRICRPRRHALDVRGFILVEPRQHVIREIAPGVAATHADSEPGKLVTEMRDERLQPVVTASRPSRPRSQLGERQLHFVDDDEQVVLIDLVIPKQRANRLAARVHESHRLGQQRVAIAPARRDGLRRRGIELRVRSSRQFVEYREPDVVSSATVLRSRISEPDDDFHYFFLSSFSSSASSFLPFLMTSGSAGAAGAAAAASAGAATSSAFGMITCTSIMSASLMAVHFGLAGMSRTRMP